MSAFFSSTRLRLRLQVVGEEADGLGALSIHEQLGQQFKMFCPIEVLMTTGRSSSRNGKHIEAS
jgi:hypothetical protein